MDSYDSDRDAVVARAHEAGVKAVIDVGLDIETNRAVLDYARGRRGVFPVIGFHPHEAQRFDAVAFEQQIKDNSDDIVALGEFGLDYFKEYSPKHLQKTALEASLDIAARANKPVVLHCREAERAIIPILRAFDLPRGGVMHCFSGDVDFLRQTLDLGLHISVGGPSTYPKAEKLERVLKAVPRDRVLLETDCPYLSPQKFRGKRNEPAYIPVIAERIAEIWQTTADDVGNITTGNAASLFDLDINLFAE